MVRRICKWCDRFASGATDLPVVRQICQWCDRFARWCNRFASGATDLRGGATDLQVVRQICKWCDRLRLAAVSRDSILMDSTIACRLCLVEGVSILFECCCCSNVMDSCLDLVSSHDVE
eukprot:scaffold98_cov172-Amphora_coffeaeformis.AAC.3